MGGDQLGAACAYPIGRHSFEGQSRVLEWLSPLGVRKGHEAFILGRRRPNYDNVDLSSEGVEPDKRRLIAMDHGLCFIRSGEDLTSRLAHIDKVRDEHVYGLFPEFREKLRDDIIEVCAARLKEMDIATARAMIATVPTEWEVSKKAREAWAELIYRRAGFVADNVLNWIDKAAPLFEDLGVRLVRPHDADAFANEVEKSAH